MIYFVAGLPNNLTRWAQAFVASLIGDEKLPATMLHANLPREITKCILLAGAVQSGVVVATNQPGGRLRKALTDSNRPYLVVLDGLLDAICEIVCDGGQSLEDALRLVASSCPALLACKSNPRVMVLDRGPRHDGVPALCAAIARHLELPCRDEAVKAADAAWRQTSKRDAKSWWLSLDAVKRSIVEAALGGFNNFSEAIFPSKLIWHPSLFIGHEGLPLSGPVDITGRARNLIVGPGIALPSGAWRLSLKLAFSGGAIEHEFGIDVCAGKSLSATQVRPAAEGELFVSLEFFIDEIFETPVTVLITLDRAAFDGSIALIEAALEQCR